MHVDRKDIDDRPGGTPPGEMLDDPLHEEERRPSIDRMEPLPKVRRPINDAAAVRQAGRVHEAVDAPEAAQRLVDDVVWRRGVTQLCGDELGGGAAAVDLGCNLGPAALVATREGDRLCASLHRSQRDRTTDPLCRARYQDDTSIHAHVHARRFPYVAINLDD